MPNHHHYHQQTYLTITIIINITYLIITTITSLNHHHHHHHLPHYHHHHQPQSSPSSPSPTSPSPPSSPRFHSLTNTWQFFTSSYEYQEMTLTFASRSDNSFRFFSSLFGGPSCMDSLALTISLLSMMYFWRLALRAALASVYM